jgi:hypothetical protein
LKGVEMADLLVARTVAYLVEKTVSWLAVATVAKMVDDSAVVLVGEMVEMMVERKDFETAGMKVGPKVVWMVG